MGDMWRSYFISMSTMSIYHGHVHHVHVYHVQKDGAEEEGIFFAYGYGGREQKEVLAHLKSDKKKPFPF